MKKRLTSLFLCVLLVTAAFTGFSVHADEEGKFLSIGEVTLEATNLDVFGDGTAAYDAETDTLTLHDFVYEGKGAEHDGKITAIYANTNLNLVITGENSAYLERETAEDGADVFGLYVAGNLTVSGEGEFDAAGCNEFDALFATGTRSTGIYCGGLLDAKSGVIVGIGGDATVRSCGVNAMSLIVEGGTVVGLAGEANEFSLGVRTQGETTVTDGALKGYAGDNSANAYGIHITERGSFAVSGGSVLGVGGADCLGTSSGIRVASTCGDSTYFTDGKLEFAGENYGFDGDYGPHLGGYVEVIANGGYQGYSTSMSLRHPTPYFDGFVKMTAGATDVNAVRINDIDSYEYEDEYVRIKMAGQYEDVNPDSWYANAVRFCSERAFLSGTSATLFSPNMTMTRAMFVQMLAKMDGADLASYADVSTFDDVPAGKWYSAAVEWASDKGITGGVGNGCFDPNGQVSREQIAVFLKAFASYKGYDTDAEADIDGYTDAGDVHAWAVSGLKWAIGCDIISGTSATTLMPQMIATRCQVAQMAMKFCIKFGV